MKEFQQYDLIIKYRSESQVTISDALSRRSDYFNFIRLRRKKKEEYISYMCRFLIEKAVSEDLMNAIKNRLVGKSDRFVMKDDVLCRKINEIVVSYVEFVFKDDLMKKIHRQYGHLSFAGLKNVIESRA